MPKVCFRCGKDFEFKSGVIRHLKRKNLCPSIFLDITAEEVNSKYEKLLVEFELEKRKEKKDSQKSDKDSQYDIQCKSCNQTFKHKSSYYRHKKHRCKSLKNNEQIMTDVIDKLNENNISVKDFNTYISNCNNKYENCYNTVNNIVINNYGEENLSHITDADIEEVIEDDETMFVELHRKAFLDKKENRNVKLTRVDNPNISVFIDNKWVVRCANSVIDERNVIIGDTIMNYIDNNDVRNKWKKILKNQIETVTDLDVNNHVKTKTRSEIKRDIFNSQQ